MTQKVWGVEMSHTGWGYHELVANHRAGSDGEPRAQETRNNLLRYRIHYCIVLYFIRLTRRVVLRS